MKVTINTNITENVHLIGADKEVLKNWMMRNGFDPGTYNLAEDAGVETGMWHYYGSKVLETQQQKDVNI